MVGRWGARTNSQETVIARRLECGSVWGCSSSWGALVSGFRRRARQEQRGYLMPVVGAWSPSTEQAVASFSTRDARDGRRGDVTCTVPADRLRYIERGWNSLRPRIPATARGASPTCAASASTAATRRRRRASHQRIFPANCKSRNRLAEGIVSGQWKTLTPRSRGRRADRCGCARSRTCSRAC